MALLMTVMLVVMSAAPALAASDKLKEPQPAMPPGLNDGKGTEANDRPEQSADPQTGRANRFEKNGPQNGK
jgi:hypothetical protein